MEEATKIEPSSVDANVRSSIADIDSELSQVKYNVGYCKSHIIDISNTIRDMINHSSDVEERITYCEFDIDTTDKEICELQKMISHLKIAVAVATTLAVGLLIGVVVF